MTFTWRDAGFLAAGAFSGGGLALLLARKNVTPSVSAPAAVEAAEARKARTQQALAECLKGTAVMAMVYLGDQLGLYKVMARGRESWTPSRLARAAGGLQPRLVQEWLAQQAACGLLDFDAASQSFVLPRHVVALLAEPLSGSFFAPYATLMLACWKRIPTMMQAFRGKCLSPTYDVAGEELAEAMARLHVPEVKFHFIPKVLTAVDGLMDRLRGPLRCADVGASGADCTIELARHFPQATFHAFEVSDPALERARRNVQQTGLANVEVIDAKLHPLGSQKKKYDFVMCYDVLHDLAEPERLMQEVRKVLADDGVWVVVDIASNGDMAANLKEHGKAATYYGISVCVCLPSGLSTDTGLGLGTLGFPPAVAEPMFRSNGFSRVRSFPMASLEKNQVYVVQI